MMTFYNLTIILNLFVSLSSNYSQIIWSKELKFSGFDGGHPGDIIATFGNIGVFANSSQTIWPKWLKYTYRV